MKKPINKTWYKITTKNGWEKWNSINDFFDYRANLDFFHPVLKIIEVTEKQLDDSVVDELNNKLKEYYAEKSNA